MTLHRRSLRPIAWLLFAVLVAIVPASAQAGPFRSSSMSMSFARSQAMRIRTLRIGARTGSLLRRGGSALGRGPASARLRFAAGRANLGAMRHGATRTTRSLTPRTTVGTIVRVRGQQRRASSTYGVAARASSFNPGSARLASSARIARGNLVSHNEVVGQVERAASADQLHVAAAIFAHHDHEFDRVMRRRTVSTPPVR